jgi:hypothetical protein
VVSLVLATNHESHPMREHQYQLEFAGHFENHVHPGGHFEHHAQPVLATLLKEPNPSQSNHHCIEALLFFLSSQYHV